MDKHEAKLREMFLEMPSERWPQFAQAMAWGRGTDGPPWMGPDERDWFWDVIDRETEKAAERARLDAAWERLTTDLQRPFVRALDWLAARIR